MPEDHYVSQTYLRHFAGPNGMLRAYRKSDGRSFPCRPRDVCRETDGDVVPDFLSEPGFLGIYRGSFEPLWNSAVAALASRRCDMQDKQVVAGYWANLLVCTPTWRRMGVLTYDRMTVDYLNAHLALSEKKGTVDPVIADAMEMLRAQKLTLCTDPNFIRAQSVISMMKHMWRLYNADWTVMESETVDFVTSDNPACFLDQGEWTGRPPREFVRYLPISPRMCLSCDIAANYKGRDVTPDFDIPPEGGIRGGHVSPQVARNVNVSIAKCAENLVFTGAEDDGIRRMVEKYAGFRVDVEFQKIPAPGGHYIASRTRTLERMK